MTEQISEYMLFEEKPQIYYKDQEVILQGSDGYSTKIRLFYYKDQTGILKASGGYKGPL